MRRISSIRPVLRIRTHIFIYMLNIVISGFQPINQRLMTDIIILCESELVALSLLCIIIACKYASNIKCVINSHFPSAYIVDYHFTIDTLLERPVQQQ